MQTKLIRAQHAMISAFALSWPIFAHGQDAESADWTTYCIGNYLAKAPSDLQYQQELSTHIDFNYVEIIHDFQGSAHDAIVSHPRFGTLLQDDEINGWTYIVASERPSEGMEFGTGEGVVFFGAQKIGDTVVLLEKTYASEAVPEGESTTQRDFLTQINVEEIGDEIPADGICVDGFVFTGYTPAMGYDFSASLARETDDATEYFSQKYLSIWLSADISTGDNYEGTGDEAWGDTTEAEAGTNFPEVHHDGRAAQISVFDTEFGTDFTSITPAPEDQLEYPLIEVEYHNLEVPRAQSEKEFIAILQDIKRREPIAP